MSKEISIPISKRFIGATNRYNVILNNECVYSTNESRDADLFIAELKARILIRLQEHE